MVAYVEHLSGFYYSSDPRREIEYSVNVNLVG